MGPRIVEIPGPLRSRIAASMGWNLPKREVICYRLQRLRGRAA